MDAFPFRSRLNRWYMNQALQQVLAKYDNCKACELHKKRVEYVFFRGVSPCQVLFIGEAPGNDEAMIGEPFVGRSGDVLNSLIRRVSDDLHIEGFVPKQVKFRVCQAEYAFSFGITNIVACRPTIGFREIRQPTKEEALACRDRLIGTVEACSPQAIVLLGKIAELNYNMPNRLGKIPTVALEHPASIARQGGEVSSAFDINAAKLKAALEEYLYGVQPKRSRKAFNTFRKSQQSKRTTDSSKTKKAV